MSLHKFLTVHRESKEAVLSWSDRHKPKRAADMVCNQPAVRKITKWLRESQGKPNQILAVIGPHGCGKTLGCNLAAADAGVHPVWKDHQETQNKQFMEELNHLSSNESYNTAVFVDNIDLNAKNVVDFVKSKKKVAPMIVLISNNTYGALNGILDGLDVVHFTTIPGATMAEVSKQVLAKEGVAWNLAQIKALVSRSVGDMRYFLLQLEFLYRSRAPSSSPWEATKRLEHVGIFSACEELLNAPNLGIAKGTYLASLDGSMVPALLFENYYGRFQSVSDACPAAEQMSVVDLAQAARCPAELTEALTYSVNLPCRKGCHEVKGLRYPSVFSKIYLENNTRGLAAAVRSRAQRSTFACVDPYSLSEHFARLVKAGNFDSAASMVHGYRLNLETALAMLKIATCKFSLKTSVKNKLTALCIKYED